MPKLTAAPWLAAAMLAISAPLAAQDPETILAEVLAAENTVQRPDLENATADQIEHIYAARRLDAQRTAARIALREHRFRLREGLGVFVRGRLLLLVNKPDEALAAFEAYIRSTQSGSHYHQALLFAAELTVLYGDGPEKASHLLAACDVEAIGEKELTLRHKALRERLNQYLLRAQLHGLPCPPLDPAIVIGPDANPVEGKDFSLAKYEGKAVVLFFFTPWAVVCQQELRDLAQMRKEYGDTVQFIAITGASGAAWVWNDKMVKPGMGSIVRPEEGALPLKQEVAYLAEFVRRCQLEDVPFLFERRGHSAQHFQIRQHPMTFVLDKKGTIVGHMHGWVPAAGQSSPSLRRLEGLLERALGKE